MISKLLLYQLKITKDFQKNQEQDLKELSDGTNIGQTNQTKNNNLNYLIDPKFTKVNRLFVLSFENENDRASFSKHYVPNVQIKDFNVLIDGKCFFDISIKYDEETYKQIIEMGRNNDYTTGNLLDYE